MSYRCYLRLEDLSPGLQAVLTVHQGARAQLPGGLWVLALRTKHAVTLLQEVAPERDQWPARGCSPQGELGGGTSTRRLRFLRSEPPGLTWEPAAPRR